MKNRFILFLVFIFLISLFSFNVIAKSGCCSHHGGVCGSECCDGSALSVACGGSGSTSSSDSSTTSSTSSISTGVTPSCSEVASGEKYCNDYQVFQNWRSSDCKVSPKLIISCAYSCKDGACQPKTCEEQNNGDVYCKDSNLYQNWQSSNCNISSKLIEDCSYDCENGKCIEKPIELQLNEEVILEIENSETSVFSKFFSYIKSLFS